MVLQGCGGNLNEWLDGMTNMFKENELVKDDFKFKEAFSFENMNMTNLVLPLDNINVGKLAIFCLQIRKNFGAMWLSDYCDNYLYDKTLDENIPI